MKCQVSLRLTFLFLLTISSWSNPSLYHSSSPLIWPKHSPFISDRWVSQICLHLHCLCPSVKLCLATTPPRHAEMPRCPVVSICPTYPHLFNAHLRFTKRIYLPYSIIFMFIPLYVCHYNFYIILLPYSTGHSSYVF